MDSGPNGRLLCGREARPKSVTLWLSNTQVSALKTEYARLATPP